MFMDEDLVASLGLSNPAKEKEKQVKTEPDESPKPNGLHLVTSAPKEEDVVRKREVVYLIQQLSAMAKNVQIGARTALLRTLVDRGILFLVQWAFAQPESDPEGKAMIAAAGDIFTPLLEFDLIGVRGHVVKQLGLIERDKEAAKKGEKGRERETLLMLLCRVLVRSKDLAIQSQLGEHISLILEVPSSETEPHVSANLSACMNEIDPLLSLCLERRCTNAPRTIQRWRNSWITSISSALKSYLNPSLTFPSSRP